MFVVAFAVYPIAAAMFERARLPRTLIPASTALGAFTYLELGRDPVKEIRMDPGRLAILILANVTGSF